MNLSPNMIQAINALRSYRADIFVGPPADKRTMDALLRRGLVEVEFCSYEQAYRNGTCFGAQTCYRTAREANYRLTSSGRKVIA